MIRIRKQWKWLTLMICLAVWCMGCSDDSSHGPLTSSTGDFTRTPEGEIQGRIEALKKLLTKDMYEVIFSGSRNNTNCREVNRTELNLPDEPNGQWYYTYDNLIKGMADWKEFANEEDENRNKLEIAAFLANIAQETGTHDGDPFGGPGCAIQEGYGSAWKDCRFGGCTPEGIGYAGRGPHQLTYDYNYKAFGEAMGNENLYLNDPDLLTKDPVIGIAGSIWFWGHADLGWGKDPKKPFKPSAHNVVHGKWAPTEKDITCGRKMPNLGVVTNIINGGVECCKCTYTEKILAEQCCVTGYKCEYTNPETHKCEVWGCRCCDSLEDCVSKDCQKPDQRAVNRVEYFKEIAKTMKVAIPDGFLDDCSKQLNFANCLSY